MSISTYARRNIRTMMVEIAIHRTYRTALDAVGDTLVFGEPNWQMVPEGEVGPNTLELEIEHMQAIFTELWRDGMRPEGWQESTPLAGADTIKEYERQLNKYRKDIGRERERLHRAELRLDRALSIIELGPSYKGRVMRKVGSGNEEEKDTET